MAVTSTTTPESRPSSHDDDDDDDDADEGDEEQRLPATTPMRAIAALVQGHAHVTRISHRTASQRAADEWVDSLQRTRGATPVVTTTPPQTRVPQASQTSDEGDDDGLPMRMPCIVL